MNLSTNLAVAGRVAGLFAWVCLGAELPAPALVSASPGAISLTPAGSSHAPSVSADGRFVTFVSAAPNVVAGDKNGRLDVFRRDRVGGRTVLVSVNAAGSGSGNGVSPGAAMSSDGRWVAFESLASDLVAGDTNGLSDVFLRDLETGQTRLLSRRADGTGSGNGASTAAQITPDGRFVLFLSKAFDLTAGDTNEFQDLFLYDVQAKGLERVSVAPETAAGAILAQQGLMSADGRFVAFLATYGAGFAATQTGGTDVFLRDRQSGQTRLVSEPTNPAYATRATQLVLSADGRVVEFQADWRYVKTDATTNGPAVFFLRDVAGGLSRAVPIPAGMPTTAPLSMQGPTLSANGALAAWSSAGQVYVWDDAARQHTLVSLAADGSGPAGGASTAVQVSPDGRYVWFLSQATNLTVNPPPVGWQLYRRGLVGNTTVAVSFSPGHTGNGDVVDWDTTPDQTVVVFESNSTELTAGDFNGEPEIFARMLATEDFEAASVADATAQPAITPVTMNLSRAATTGTGPAAPLPAALSSDGRRLVHLSSSHVDESGELAGYSLRVTDLDARTNVAVIRFPQTPEVPTTLVSSPQLTADGRALVFVSSQNGLVPGDTNGLPDVFRRDLETGELTLVSDYSPGAGNNQPVGELAVGRAGGRVAFTRFVYGKGELWLRAPDQPKAVRLSAAGPFSSLSFSADGRWLAVACTGRVTPNDSILSMLIRNNCYLYDLATEKFELVSQGGPNTPSWGAGIVGTQGEAPVLSADASRVAYVSVSRAGTSLAQYEIFLRDRAAARTTVLSLARAGTNQSHHATQPGISRDGRRVVFLSNSTNLVEPGWTNATQNVFVRHVDEHFTTLVSVNRDGTGPGNAPSREAQLSPSGRFVVFRSAASDLVADDTNGVADLFLRDVDAGVTYLLGHAADGTLPDAAAGAAIWSDDSRLVVFESHAANLPGGDVNPGRDLFVLRLAGPDLDGDGMDDDWEMTYFSTLTRTGADDFDADGASDLAEFRAGTNPTQNQSVLRALTVAPAAGGAVTVLWKAEKGRRYVVQTKTLVEDTGWRNLPGVVVAEGDTASYVDEAAAGERQFYRVLAVN